MICSIRPFCRSHFSVPALMCLALLGGSPRSSLAADMAPVAPAIPAIDLCRGQFKAGQYEQCIESAQKAIEERAFSAEWRALLIESRMALGQYAEAAEDANSIIQYYSLSFRLLKLGYEVYTCNGQAEKESEMLARIYQIGTHRHIDFLDSEDLVILGETLLLLGGEPRLVLGQFFNRAIRNDPNCREAYLAAGSLALAKQDYDLAANQYRKAIQRFGDDPDAHYGLARAFYQSDRAEMVKSLDAALHVNLRHAPALILLAEHRIDCEDYDGAAGLLDRIVAVNPWRPEAWAYRALLAHLADDPNAFKTCRANALKFWPTNPQVDHLVGSKLSQKYRFAEGAEFQRGALKFDPDYLPAKIQLAQDLLRLGDERNGWMLADEVHARDAYNVEAYNLANLRDNLAKFKTLLADGFIVRMDPFEAGVYGDSVLELLGRAKSHLCGKYGLELAGPITVELFPSQQDFAVRTFGMPGGEGFLGVCFGSVITARSPRLDNPSNWQAMLWHEFCHVVTLKLTQNRMPRWLSEGISVYEELRHNPAWGQQMNPEYRKMVLSGELTPVGDLSAAFLNPPTPMHLQFAYYESALLVEFLVERFGLETLKSILSDLAKGVQINTAIARRAGRLRRIERQFDAFARKRAENLAPAADWTELQITQIDASDPNALTVWLAEHPNSVSALTLQAKMLLAQQKWQEAKEPLEKLISLYPQYAGKDNAYFLLAGAHRNLNEIEKEYEALDKLAALSSDAAYTYDRLMEIDSERQNWRQVIVNAQRHLQVYPLLGATYARLGRACGELDLDDQAVEAYRRLLLLDPADPADVHYRLALLLQRRDPTVAKRHVLEALADTPRFRQAHRLLLEILNDAGNTQENSQPPKPQEKMQ